MSTYLIGTDEAGYGPNLGPLVVSATLWELDESSPQRDLYARLADLVVLRARDAGANNLAIADSKNLYKPRGTLKHLERAIFGAWKYLDREISTAEQFFDAADPSSREDRLELPWADEYQKAVPSDLTAETIDQVGRLLKDHFSAVGVRLVDLRSRVVYPSEFNRLCDRYDSKGLALSRITMGLLERMVRQCGDAEIEILCDKHGGRNRYAELLGESWPDEFIEIYEESREVSCYRFGRPERRVSIKFQARGESFLPAALASMQCKLLRELAMGAFNRHWSEKFPALKPTAGYPQDARRWRDATEKDWESLGIEPDMIWRRR
jgi:hypothetical protein